MKRFHSFQFYKITPDVHNMFKHTLEDKMLQDFWRRLDHFRNTKRYIKGTLMQIWKYV